MKNINLKNIAISSLIAVSTCFAMVGTATAAPQTDSHHLTQKQKNEIAAKQEAKQKAALKAKQVAKQKAALKAKQVAKQKAILKAKQEAKHKAELKAKHKDDKFQEDRKHS
jgi:hypothetical protein